MVRAIQEAPTGTVKQVYSLQNLSGPLYRVAFPRLFDHLTCLKRVFPVSQNMIWEALQYAIGNYEKLLRRELIDSHVIEFSSQHTV